VVALPAPPAERALARFYAALTAADGLAGAVVELRRALADEPSAAGATVGVFGGRGDTGPLPDGRGPPGSFDPALLFDGDLADAPSSAWTAEAELDAELRGLPEIGALLEGPLARRYGSDLRHAIVRLLDAERRL